MVRSLFRILLLWLVILSNNIINLSEAADIIPVIFIHYGKIPRHLKYNIELSSRFNPTIVLTDMSFEDWNNNTDTSLHRFSVKIESMKPFAIAANAFSRIYKHISKDNDPNYHLHELHCIQRWFVLQEYMKVNNLKLIFTGDIDTAIFSSMTKAWNDRKECSAVISIGVQRHRFQWLGGGESSLWSQPAIDDFCAFTRHIYENNIGLLSEKHKQHGSTVSDGSLLWLWWTAHKQQQQPGWATGRPYLTFNLTETEAARKQHDEAFVHSRALPLPTVNEDLLLCNSLDVVHRTVFDHYHAWDGCGNFSLSLESDGIPRCFGACLTAGGKPETLDSAALHSVITKPLQLLTLHYRGDAKGLLLYDLCRVLTMTGDKKIANYEMNLLCGVLIKNKMRGQSVAPCAGHPLLFSSSSQIYPEFTCF